MIYRITFQRWPKLRLAALVSLFIPMILSFPSGVSAQVPAEPGQICSPLALRSVNMGILELRCAFATNQDQITLYSSTEIDPGRPWESQLDDRDADWVFDAGADGQAELIIKFSHTSQNVTAAFYDDQDGNSYVTYKVTNDRVEVEESNFPTVRVVGGSDWSTASGKFDFNVDVYIDGPVLGAFQAEKYQSRMQNDGGVDIHALVRDRDHDGLPDYEIIQATPDVPEDWGIYRTLVMVNPHDDELPITNAVLWPLLGTVYGPVTDLNGVARPTAPHADNLNRTYGIVKDYDSSFPPIQVDWNTGRIIYVGEFVASRANDHNYFIYSIRNLDSTQFLEANFEAPFVFYDLAQDSDRHPELIVRYEHYSPSDYAFAYGGLNYPTQSVRYSWDQDNDNYWDYSVNMVGRHPATDDIKLPELRFRTFAPDTIAAKTIPQEWDGATFVAVENGFQYDSTEGIYEWPAGPIRREKLRGSTRYSGPDYNTITEQLRGEYTDRTGQVTLYMSPVDHKLHLVGVQRGLWQISPTTSMSYTNFDDDDYIDQWKYTEVVTTTAAVTRTTQLNIADEFATYADDSRVVLRQASVEHELWRTAPPATHSEWLALSEQLQTSTQPFDPANLYTTFARFAGQQLEIRNAALRDFRMLAGSGFRFVLQLKPGYTVDGALPFDLANREPGEYVVRYDGTFSIEPLAPASLQMQLVMRENHTPTANQIIPLRFQVQNSGTEDLSQVILVVDAAGANGSVRVGRQIIDTLAGETKTVDIDWQPPVPGQWTINARVQNVENVWYTTLRQPVAVTANAAGDARAILPFVLAESHAVPLLALLLLAGAMLGISSRLVAAYGSQPEVK